MFFLLSCGVQKRTDSTCFWHKKMENEYVCPSDSDESSENEQFCFLLQPNARVTAVSSPEEPPSRENVVVGNIGNVGNVSTNFFRPT